MANSFNDLTQVVLGAIPTFIPQVLSASDDGLAVDVRKVGMNRINAMLILGDAVALTSLDVKIQASPDGTNDWVDIDGAEFTQVTADPGATGVVSEMIVFDLPKSLTLSTEPYQYVRAVATLVGTSIALAVVFLANRKYDGSGANVSAPGNDGNNVIN